MLQNVNTWVQLAGWVGDSLLFLCGGEHLQKHFDGIEVYAKDTVTHSFHLVGLKELTNMVSKYPVFDTRSKVGMLHIIPKSYCQTNLLISIGEYSTFFKEKIGYGPTENSMENLV